MSTFVLAHQGLIVLAAALITTWGFAAWVIDTRLAGRRGREITLVVPRQPPSPESAGFRECLIGTRNPCP